MRSVSICESHVSTQLFRQVFPDEEGRLAFAGLDTDDFDTMVKIVALVTAPADRLMRLVKSPQYEDICTSRSAVPKLMLAEEPRRDHND